MLISLDRQSHQMIPTNATLMQVSTIKQIMWTNNFDENKKNLERNSNEANANFPRWTKPPDDNYKCKFRL